AMRPPRPQAEPLALHDALPILGGAVIVENVFTLPGVGRLVVQAIEQRDYPLVQSVVFAVAALVILVNLLVDLSYAWVDPRIRYRSEEHRSELQSPYELVCRLLL